MPTGLIRRGATYSLRRRVPLDLVDAYGKREIIKALGTSNREEAKKLHAVEWVRLNNEFDQRRAVLKATGTTVEPKASPLGALAKYRQETARKPISILKTIVDANARLNKAEHSPVSGVASPEGRPVRAGAKTLSWDKLVDMWAAERKPAPKTRKAHGAVATQFAALVGKQPDALTKADVLAFKAKLVEKNETSANLRTKLSRLKTLINYGHENGLVKERAADGVRAPKSKVKPRVPFDDQSLQLLFNGPVHREGVRPTLGRGEAAYWLPLIALYTGARLEEIAHLRIADLVQLRFEGEDGTEHEAWFFKFTPDPARNRTLKNSESERTVPVHPELVRLGLIQYRDAIRASNETQLFPRLTQHASGLRAHKWGQWFGSYLRKDCAVTDTRKVFHSFRHTLKDACRESGVTEELQRAIMGHDATGVAGSYGLGFSRRRIVEGMNRVRVQGLPDIKPAAWPSDAGSEDGQRTQS